MKTKLDVVIDPDICGFCDKHYDNCTCWLDTGEDIEDDPNYEGQSDEERCCYNLEDGGLFSKPKTVSTYFTSWFRVGALAGL